MLFQRRDHKDVGNTCRALLHGTQQESKAQLQVLCKAVATTSVRQGRNAPTYLLVVFYLCRWDGHRAVTVVWVKITSPGLGKGLKVVAVPSRAAQDGTPAPMGAPSGALRPQPQGLLAKSPSGTAVTHRCQADSTFVSNTPCLVSFDVLKRSPWVGGRELSRTGI